MEFEQFLLSIVSSFFLSFFFGVGGGVGLGLGCYAATAPSRYILKHMRVLLYQILCHPNCTYHDLFDTLLSNCFLWKIPLSLLS